MKKFLLTSFVFCLFLTNVFGQLLISHTNVNCNGTCDGTATVNPSGSYHYLWSTGDTVQAITGLCAGTYVVTVSDAVFTPLDTLTVVITEPAPLIVSGNAIPVTCFGSFDGSIVVTASGGTGAFAYTWGAGMTTPFINNLPAGVYCVTVSDANACIATSCYFINEPTQLLVSVFDSNATSCSSNDGYIDLFVTGGSAPYVYMWSNGSTTQNQWGLAVGVYSVTIVDANGCSASAMGTITSPNNITGSMVANDIDCDNPVSNATLTVSNGTAPYSVSWGDGSVSSWGSGVFNHTYTQAGVYFVQFYDTVGCQNYLIDSIVNTGLSAVIGIYQYPSCGVGTNGILFADVYGGSPPYFFNWSNGETTDTIFNLTTGSYLLTVTDSTGCTATAGRTLPTNSNLYTYLSGTAASCMNGGVGSATIYTSGGTPPFSYVWSSGHTTQTANNIAAGVYSYTVTDNTGCVAIDTAVVTFSSYSFYVYLSTVTQPNCGAANGSLTATSYGGTAPYTYLWNNSQTTQTATGLAQGSFQVTVTDAGGCTSTGSAFLQNSCYNTITGTIFNDVNGNCIYDAGDSPFSGYTVIANNGNGQYYGYTNASGVYTITVNDSGTFNLQAIQYYSSTCGVAVPCGNPNPTAVFHGFNNTVTQNFGFVAGSGFDLTVHPGWTSANPGFPKNYWIYYYNSATQPFSGTATITFKYDSFLTYLYTDAPLPSHNPATRTLTWTTNSVDNWDYRGQIHFTVMPTTPAGYHLQSDFGITPTAGDCDSTNNFMHFSELVTSSMDPNEKEVEPAGNIFEEDSTLTYTIHFQNTGTDTTWFVIIKDTLDAALDPLSVRNLASSHPYSDFNISGTGFLEWVFNPIYLVDSSTNEPASKGFVKFSIKKKAGLPIGTPIKNNASIYFDYNTPVVTNTVTNTIADPNFVFEVRGDNGVSVMAYPNPFSDKTQVVVEGLKGKFDFNLFDVTGRLRKTIGSIENSRFEMQRGELTPGIYFYRISSGKKQMAFGKLVVE